MCNRFLFGILLALTAPAAFAKTALDLMLEGRFGEAKAILDTSNVSPRYQLLYFAMIESEAGRACSLYQVIALRYPNSDCDSVARLRLDQAQEAGFVLVPIAEWAQAAPGARPLALRREHLRVSEAEVHAPEAVEPSPPPVLVAWPVLPVPVSVEAQAPPAAEPEATKEEPQVSVRDTIVAVPTAPEPVEPLVVDTVVSQPPPVVHEIISAPVEAPHEPVVREAPVPPAPPSVQTPIVEPPPVSPPPVAPAVEKVTPPPAREQAPIAEPPPVSPPPVAPAVEKVTPPPVVEAKETAAESPPAPVSLDRPASNSPWYIQVGAFGNFDNAHRLALLLQNAGYPVKLVPRDSAKGQLLQVRVGGYATRTELAPIAEQLKEKFRVPTVLVSE